MNIACTICHESFTGNDTVALMCGHVFHRLCLSTWIRTDLSCPMCRRRTNTREFRKIYFNTVTDPTAETMKKTMDALQKAKTTLQRQNDELKRENREMQEKLVNAQQTMEQHAREIADNLATLKQSCTELTEEKTRDKQTMRELRATVKTLNSQLKMAVNEKQQHKKSKDFKAQEVARLRKLNEEILLKIKAHEQDMQVQRDEWELWNRKLRDHNFNLNEQLMEKRQTIREMLDNSSSLTEKKQEMAQEKKEEESVPLSKFRRLEMETSERIKSLEIQLTSVAMKIQDSALALLHVSSPIVRPATDGKSRLTM